MLAWPDGTWVPLLFDGQPALSSAVLLSPDGGLLTGQGAWQAAAAAPDRFIPTPRRSPEQITVAGTQVDGLDVVAATLRRVAEEAQRTARATVSDVRMVVPAGWGPRRRTWLRQAAHRAGLAQPRLVEAPVAVAGYLVASGVQLPVGSFVVVCDLGAGAEVSVLRRGPTGFEVLATLADPDAGGAAIDRSLTEALAGGDPSSAPEQGGWWALAASVREAKHALAIHPAVTVALPSGSATVLNAPVLEQAAFPVLRRAARLTGEVITAAEIERTAIAGIYCAGGAAQTPALEKVFIEVASLNPVVVSDPGLAAVRGAADAGAAAPAGEPVTANASPVPSVRRAAAIAVPGFASLALVSQFLLTPVWSGGGVLWRWATLNWGELAMAAVFAVVASLGAGTVIGAAVAAREPSGSSTSPGAHVGTGILASASLGTAVAGMYAVVGSLYIGDEVGPFLRWALLPIAPIVVVATVMALVAARAWRTPRGGWADMLAFPVGSVITATAGMVLIQYSLVADRWPDMVVWIDLAGRIGGLLLGVAVVMAVVSPLLLRIILAAPLGVITAALVSRPASGILGVIYAIAVTLWWIRQVWTRIIRTDPRPVDAR
ncbi:Hsp70 family protein [Micromonospora sp. RHAY321]|uniref:Hsp70 family protein n=1 Tax=Micromonospora sp. RHAY321 TaxID=2944807 RepID=UPI00207D0362|nr:Hsp70 family protein [Micromonospora sp. RHAY321]MCO1593795.1 Hsp70 family protein [Micromonospora sp. RHAY321]